MRKLKFCLTCLVAVLVATAAFAQNLTVAGTVTDNATGEPVPFASIQVKGTMTGVATDADGKYSLDVSKNATLVFSSIGYLTQEVAVAGRGVINVALAPDAEALDEAVITIAYGAAKKSSLTGAISSVNSEKLAMRPNSSVTSALEGTVTGVQVAGTYGSPGTDPSFRIRGIGTVNGSSSPLYVIDGVPFGGNISDLNPADIESLTVLKDAASAALYGNRASNGVILITTKQAQAGEGRVSVNLDIKQGFYERGIKEYELLNPYEWMQAQWMNLRNFRINGMGDDAASAAVYASKYLVEDIAILNIFNRADGDIVDTEGNLVKGLNIKRGYQDDLNWFDQSTRKGYRQEYNVSGQVATQKADAFFSLGYLKENGYMTNNDFSRFNGRASVNIKPASWIKVGLNLSGSHQNFNNTSGVGDSSSAYINAFMYCRKIAPIYPVHLHDVNTGDYLLDANGDLQYDGGSYIDAKGNVVTTRKQFADRHVIWENELNFDKSVRNTLDGIAYVDFYFLKDFTFTVKADMNVRNNDNYSYNSAVIGDGKGSNGRAKKVVYRYKNYTLQEQLRWNHAFGQHTISALIGHENYYYNYDYMYSYKTSQVFAGKGNLTNFTEMTSLDGWQTNYRTESYLGRVRYSYADKYNVEASFRRDGSSRFAKNVRWGNFWSIGANWMISKENFMQNADWVNSLKLRADFGQVGNDSGAGYYGYMALYTAEQNANAGAYYIAQLPNDDLKWETGQSWGVGIESRLFNRLNFNIEYFDKTNKDLIFDVYNPLSAGATSSGSAESVVTKNIGRISNRGVEIEADVDIVRTKDWRVNFGANATFLKNKVLELPEQNKDGIISGVYNITEGRDRYAFYTYTWAGVDRLDGQSLYKFNTEKYYITDNNKSTGGVIYGHAVDSKGNANTLMTADNYRIINGEPYVTNTTYALKEFHGSALPKVYGSFNLSVGWKSLNISALFTYQLGGKMYESNYQDLMTPSGTAYQAHRNVLNSWMYAPAGMAEDSPNRINPNGIPEFNYYNSTDNDATSSRWIMSSNYLIFKNLAVNYSLPKKWAKALEMSGINIGISCENVFTKTALLGTNPQQGFSGGQGNYLTTPRVFTGSISFKF